MALPIDNVRVREFEALPYLFEPDTRSAFIRVGFGMITIAYLTPDLLFVFRDEDVDETQFGGGDAVFKGILYQ